MRLDIVHLSKEKYTISDEFRSSVYTVVFPPGSSDTLNVIKAGQAEDEAIAKVVFRILRADSVIFRGKERSAGDWLQKKLLSSTRTWVAMSERRYSWAAAGVSSLTLKNANGEDLGRSHNASRGLVGKEKHVAFIELSDADEVFADLDEIIVTWVYLKEKEKRDRGEID